MSCIVTMRELIIKKNEAGQSLLKYLHKYMKDAGNGFLYKMLRKKNITLNKKKADGTEILTENDAVALFMSDDTIDKFRGIGATEDIAKEYFAAYERLKGIKVIYENEDILILDKPVGILSQKASDSDISINEWVIGYMLKNGKLNVQDLETFKPSVCNRLDRNTGGLILAGVSLKGLQILGDVLKNRSLHKYYYTICEGHPGKELHLYGAINKNERTNTVSVQLRDHKSKDCNIETIARALSYGNKYTLLEVELVTGKSHQIRAHLSKAGYPLVGDVKYGGKPFVLNNIELNHQLLYAYRMVFPKLDVLKELSESEISIEMPLLLRNIMENDHADL